MKKLLTLTLALCLMIGILVPTTAAASTKFWLFAAPPASSALYPFWVSMGDAIPTVYPEYAITVSESQGAVAISKRVRSGEAEIGNSVSATDYENYHGLGLFEGDPFPDLRMLFYYEVTAEMICVSKESGITTIEELAGQRFNPGGVGTSAADIFAKVADALDIKPNYFQASQADAADAYANKEIVGTVKLGSFLDSYVMQLDAARPVVMLDIPEETLDKVIEQYPYLIKVTIPAGTYTFIDHDVNTFGTPQGAQTTTALSQEDGYKVCKAVMDDGAGKKVWQSAYPIGAENDLIDLTLRSAVPLHAGTVQYLVEKGIEVPENLIPAEYVPVK